MTKIERRQAELDRIKIIPRWGKTRRFHTDKGKFERREWLIRHIVDEQVKEPKP